MSKKLGSDSVLQWDSPERLFKRRTEACWAETPRAAALPARGKDGGHGLLPLSAAGQIDEKGAQRGDFSAPAEAAQSGEFGTLFFVKAVDWELEGWG